MFDGALKIVRSWGDGVDHDALLDAVKGLVTLTIGTCGVRNLKDMQDHGEYISGPALLGNVGLNGNDRYLASGAVVAVAAAIRSHLDAGNYNGDAVRRSLTALFLSGKRRRVLPTVAEATELKPFEAEALELDLDLTTEQAGLVGAAFGITAPLEYATKVREATVLKRALHIGHSLLGLLLDDKIDVDGVHEEIVLGRDDDEGEIYKLLYEASEIPAADEPHAFADGVAPVLDALLEHVRSAMVTGDTTLRKAKARAVLDACAGTRQARRGVDGYQYEFRDIYPLSRQHLTALGVASACLAVLQHEQAVDPHVATALVASICAAGRASMLVPSAMECEKIKAGVSLLEFMCMMPERDRSAAIQAYMMRAVARKLTSVQLTEEAEWLLDEAIARQTYDPMRRVRESELDRAAGRMSETNDGDDRHDTTYEYESESEDDENPFLRRKELFKKKKKQAARVPPEVVPEKADLPFVAGLATMPLIPVTTKAPEPMDLAAELEKLFRNPKRRAGAHGDKKKSPAKPREDPTKKTKAKDDNRFSILNESFGGDDGDADTATAPRSLF